MPAVQGGSKGDTIEHPLLATDQPDLPMILAHGTSIDAFDSIFAEGVVPGNGIRRGGRDEVHFLPIETPADIGGGHPPTECQGIDFVGLSDKSGWRGTSQCVVFVDTHAATHKGI